jgi:hypothetical protein
MDPKPTKAPIRWDWIEEQWQRGLLSNTAIGNRHGELFGRKVGEAAIRDRVSRYGWQRDIAEAVRRETRRKLAEGAGLRETAKSAEGSQSAEIVATEVAAVDAAAEEAAGVTRAHRAYATELHQLVNRLSVYAVAALPVDESGAPRLAYEPGELKDIASTVATVASARKAAADIERKAYGLDDPERGKTAADSLSDIRAFLAGS